MTRFGLILVVAACTGLTPAQTASDTDFKIALADHNGQLKWSADGFKIVRSSAKPNGREIGLRGQDGSGRLTFLGFLFLVPESAPLTSAKCRDAALERQKKSSPTLKILTTSEIARPGSLPVALAAYTNPTGYIVRGFVATGDLCGDLEFSSGKPLSVDDADLAKIFASLELDQRYVPQFYDVVFHADILYRAQMYKAAAPIFEKALTMLPENGAPFPSAQIAKRVVSDQAGMSYGIAGEFVQARAIFEKGTEQDPDYPLNYYNLACTDAGEKKLADARLHLQQAFARKANMTPGETFPDPTNDDSFLPYREDKSFWKFLERLQAGK